MLVKCLQICAHVFINRPQDQILCRLHTELCPNCGRSRARLCPISFAPCPFPNLAGTLVPVDSIMADKIKVTEYLSEIGPQLFRNAAGFPLHQSCQSVTTDARSNGIPLKPAPWATVTFPQRLCRYCVLRPVLIGLADGADQRRSTRCQ